MNTICERIKYLRKNVLKKSQKEFGETLGLKANSISCIETGVNTPSEQTLKSIAREFNINENWLKNGIGEIKKTYNAEYEKIVTLIGERDPLAKQAIIDYWELSEIDKKLFWNFVNRFIKGAES